MMEITVKPVESESDLREFITLPGRIHKNHNEWIPSLLSDDIATFTPERNEAYQYCDTIRLLAFRGQKVVGRIMGIVHHRYNQLNNEKCGRFAFFETYYDREVYAALIKSIEDWARDKGCNRLIGPLGFSDKDPQGFLIEGFDQPTMMVTNCSFPYMNEFIKELGYTPHTVLVEYKMHLTGQMMERIEPFARRAEKNPHFKLLTFTSTRQIKPYIRPVFELINRTYRNIYGFSPLSMKEADDFATRYLPFLIPGLVKVVTNQSGQVIAFLVAMSDFSRGIKKAHGKVFPFGWIPILYHMKTSKTVVLMLGAIDEEYRHRGVDALMANSLLAESRRLGFQYLDSHLIMESNIKMRRELERLDGSVLYKRYCIYQKDL